MRREVDKFRRTSEIDGAPAIGESKSRVDNPREGRRANAMLNVERIVTTGPLRGASDCHAFVTDA